MSAAQRELATAFIVSVGLRSSSAFQNTITSFSPDDLVVRAFTEPGAPDEFSLIREASALDLQGLKSGFMPWLREYARSILRPCGNCAFLVENRAEPGREIILWRHLCLRMPAMILRAASAWSDRVPMHVSILPRLATPSGPVAHLHFHAAAAHSFELLWAHVIRSNTGVLSERLGRKRPEFAPRGFSDAEWWRWLKRLPLVRRLLQRTLAHGFPSGVRSFDSELECAVWSETHSGRELRSDPEYEIELHAATRETPTFFDPATYSVPTHQATAEWMRGCISDEHKLVAALFRGACEDTAQDVIEVGLQYLRLMTMLFSTVTLAPGGQDFGTFRRALRCVSCYRLVDLTTAQELTSSQNVLREEAFEPRCSPKDLGRISQSLDSEVATGSSSITTESVGLIVHIVRDLSAGQSLRKRWRTLEKSAGEIVSAMDEPATKRWLRGLDLAGDELKGPLWMIIPLLRDIRDNADYVFADRAGASFGLTLHVGEFFLDAIGAVRAVHEPLLWRLLRTGDRLGHATGLALDVHSWRAMRDDRGGVFVPRSVRIFDLAWLIHVSQIWTYGRGGEIAMARDELSTHVAACGLSAFELADVIDAYARSLGTGHLWRLWARGEGDLCSENAAGFLVSLWDQWESDVVHEPVGVDSRFDSLLVEMQERVLRAVERAQVVVELNPSSSFVLHGGAFPLFQTSFVPTSSAAVAVPIAISADDPLTFATCLTDEFAYAWAGLVTTEHVTPTRARAWLQECAETSWRARFVGESLL